MDLADYSALSFDCYGTLIDWESGILATLRPWADRQSLALDDEELLARYGEQEARVEVEHPAFPYPEILARSFLALGDSLGVEATLADSQQLGRSVADWPAFDDSHDALELLGTHYSLIILSNVDRESFARSSERLGIEFDRVLTAQDIGSYKPSGRNFIALLDEAERMGVPEGGLLHVAQSLFHDHVPAKAHGLPTVWINRRTGRASWGATPPPSAEVVPDWEFPSMADFAAAVAGAAR